MAKDKQTRLREKRAKIKDKIVAIKEVYEAKLGAEYAKLEALRRSCSHPNIRHYNIGFDSGSQCPDCGHNV